MIMTGSPGKIRPDKVTLVAVWFGINAAISLVLVAVLHFALEATTSDAAGEPDRGLVFGALFLGRFLFIVYGALGVVAIVGLLRLRHWGRWLAMSLAVLGLILIPIHTIIMACELGLLGALAGKLLKDMGFTNVSILKGGKVAWEEAGYPTD